MYFLLIIQGVYSQLVQAVVMRELIGRFGGLEITFAIALSSMLIWTGIGCWTGSFLIRKARDYPLKSTFFIICLSPLCAIVQIVVIDLFPGLFSSLNTLEHINDLILFSVFAPLPFGIINGAVYSLLTLHKKMKNAGRNYGADAFGDTLGGLVFSLILASFAPPIALLAVLGVPIPVATFLVLRKNLDKKFILAAVSSFSVVLCILSACIDRPVSSEKWWRIMPEYCYDSSVETPYGRIDVLKTRLTKEPRTILYRDGSLLGTIPAEKDLAYPAAVFSALQPNRRNLKILVSASPFSSLTNVLLELPFVSEVDFISPEESLVRISQQYQLLPERNSKLNFINEDITSYLKKARKSYDLIIVMDQAPQTFAGNRFFSDSFYRSVNRSLAREGVYVTTMRSMGGYLSDDICRFNAIILKTLLSQFKNVVFSPGTHKILACGNSDNVTGDFALLDRRMQTLMPHFSRFPPGMMEVSFSQSAADGERRDIERFLPKVSANTGMKPVLPMKYLEIFARESAENPNNPGFLVTALTWIEEHMIYISGVIVLFYAISRFFSVRNGTICAFLSSFENGFYAMGVEILLLLVYQLSHGVLYRDLAAALGLFIGGTALGAWLNLNISERKRQLLQVIATICPLWLLFSGNIFPWQLSLLVFTNLAITGFSVGAFYQLLSLKSSGQHQKVHLWALEIFGGASGTLIIALLLLPFAGITITLAVLTTMRIVTLSIRH